jgi:hypothetical protein
LVRRRIDHRLVDSRPPYRCRSFGIPNARRENPMMKLITDLPERVLGFKASGEVTSEDDRNVLVYPPR